ncbi:3-hexulose-6-phosphate synthase [Bacillus shivajii]|nr:3-hexulose-6-phosphate synthase [Bacillus shivajii]
MKLQLALDRLTKSECFQILKSTEDYIDWIEVGTGVIKEYGVSIIKEIKEKYPKHTIVADMKTCDAGKHEAEQAFNAGADITTVMAFAADGTIKDMLEVADRYNKRVMVDLLGIESEERVKEIEDLGADLVSLHIGKDMQKDGQKVTTQQFDLVATSPNLEIAVAGGINEDSISSYISYHPNVIIVGSAITQASNKEEAAKSLKGVIPS